MPDDGEAADPAGASPWAEDAGTVLRAFGVDQTLGLTETEAASRQQRYGPNQLRSIREKSVLAVLFAQFASIVIWLLIVAAGIAIAFGDIIESLAIVAVIVINTGIGFATELRAVRSIEALRKLGRVTTTVRRDGSAQHVLADSLVPGDIVEIETGDVIAADLRIVEASKLEADESTLTGESVPVAKHSDPIPTDTTLLERANMLFKGTSVTRGSGVAVVTGIGLDTELGKISTLVLEAESEQTPLEKRLDALARRLVWLTIGIATIVGLIGVVDGREITLAVQVAIALAVAAIPEGLPIVATIALARGMWRMARRRALLARLSAVETLGATSVILADKTGTLTENRMSVSEVAVAGTVLTVTGSSFDRRLSVAGRDPDEPALELAREALMIAALCSNASVDVDGGGGAVSTVGDPTEVALLVAAGTLGITRADLLREMPEVAEEPFDPATRAMATIHRSGAGYVEAVKGAPESIVPACVTLRSADGDIPLDDDLRAQWIERSHEFGRRGLRTLAVAERRTADPEIAPYENLTLLGLIGLHDPTRPGVHEALDACRDSGITVVMVTGDHAATARHVAEDVGLLAGDAPPDAVIDGRELAEPSNLDDAARRRLVDARVIARATPEQKLNLIRMHQERDRVVAMTGDGVNDAPALKQADIGVAMGQRGTQVAREAAAMILQDDHFETIVEAVAQGRAIHANIRKFVVYLMSCNISEILIVGLATLASAPLPLLPLQILFLNLVTDVFPALALGVGEGPPDLMKQRPRPAGEPLLTRFHWRMIFVYGLVMSTTVLAAMAIAISVLGLDASGAVTVSFLTLALAQLWHVFNMRNDWKRFTRNEITRNPWVWGALVLCVVLILAGVYLPGLSAVLSLTALDLEAWIVVLAMSTVPLLIPPFGKP